MYVSQRVIIASG